MDSRDIHVTQNALVSLSLTHPNMRISIVATKNKDMIYQVPGCVANDALVGHLKI